MVNCWVGHYRACRDVLYGLLHRGLIVEEGGLCVMNGTKEIKKAGGEVFDRYALIQRCQWPKRENLVGYLFKGGQAAFRKGLQAGLGTLQKVKKELFLINESAVQSLEEHPEGTLTLHRLALFDQPGKGLKTTNCREAIMALIGRRTDKVDYWGNRGSWPPHYWIWNPD